MTEGAPDSQPVIRISRQEVLATSSQVTVEPLVEPSRPAPTPAGTRTHQLAVISFLLGAIGIPLGGCLLGPIAMACAAIALGDLRRTEQRGVGLAVTGSILGVVAFLGWTIALWVFLARPLAPAERASPGVAINERLAAADIERSPPHIQRALRANVRVVCARVGDVRLGSGVVLRNGESASWIGTNRHVADCGAEGGAVRLATIDGVEVAAELRWLAPDNIDFALLRSSALKGTRDAEPEPQPANVGDSVFAVGNPLGYDASYVVGTISAIRSGRFAQRSLKILQVQAAVNSGNSGGGLYSKEGRLLGLNTWTTDKRVAEGISFALAVPDLLQLVPFRAERWDELPPLRPNRERDHERP